MRIKNKRPENILCFMHGYGKEIKRTIVNEHRYTKPSFWHCWSEWDFIPEMPNVYAILEFSLN